MVIEINTPDEFRGRIEFGNVIAWFSAPWCIPCRSLAKILPQIADEHPEVTVLKIDIDKHPEIAQEQQIMSVPTLQLWKRGQVVRTIVGAKPKVYIEKDFEL